MRDLKRSLKKSNNSSPGPDQIHYEILRHLPIETLHILLDIINETWKSDTFPESWREALIISIPKPGKDHFNSSWPHAFARIIARERRASRGPKSRVCWSPGSQHAYNPHFPRTPGRWAAQSLD